MYKMNPRANQQKQPAKPQDIEQNRQQAHKIHTGMERNLVYFK